MIVTIAGIIITFVLCYELIYMHTEKNTLHDMETWQLLTWIIQADEAI